jgi:hypothetical protein
MKVFAFVRYMTLAGYKIRNLTWILILLFISCRKSAIVPETLVKTPFPFSVSYTNSSPIATGTITNEVPKFESVDIIKLKSGVLMAVLSNEFYHGEHNSIYASRSNDNGRTWSSPQKINMPNPNDFKLLNENIFYVGSRLFMIIQRTPGRPVEGGIPAYSFSDDNGETWSPAHLIGGIPDRKYVIINSRNVTITKTGRIIVPVGFDQATQKVGVIFSDNNGFNWSASPNLFGTVGGRFGEPTIAQLNDGRLIMLIRTSLNWIYESFSSDDGMSWSEPVPTTLQSPWTAHAMKITPEGYIVVVFTKSHIIGKDPGYPRNNLTMAVSLDNGSSWEQYTTIVDHTDPEYMVMAPSISFIDDKILVSYLHDSAGIKSPASDRSIKTALYNKFDVITGMRQDWKNFARWTRNGRGTAEIVNGNLLHLSDHSGSVAGVSKTLNFSNFYQFEFKAQVISFVNPEKGSGYSSLRTTIGTGSYRFVLRIEADGVYVAASSGEWIKYSSAQYLNSKNDWHVWKTTVTDSIAQLYMDGELIIPSYSLQATYENIGIEHSANSALGMSTNCYIDYSYYSPIR